MLSADRLRELLHYDPETGVFTWRVACGRGYCRRHPGDVAGTLDPTTGYVRIAIEGSRYYASRLAWFYVTGEWPSALIDHINGVRDDNKFANLREATRAQNNRNRKAKGAYRMPNGKWTTRIGSNYGNTYLGVFDTEAEARAAYVRAAEEVHGDFARRA